MLIGFGERDQIMFNWLREFYEIRAEYRRCRTCEELRRELDYLRGDNQRLLNKLVFLSPEVKQESSNQLISAKPLRVPWIVKQQMLEAEDRQKAKIIKDLEERMGIKDEIPRSDSTGAETEAEREDSGGEAPRSGSERG